MLVINWYNTFSCILGIFNAAAFKDILMSFSKIKNKQTKQPPFGAFVSNGLEIETSAPKAKWSETWHSGRLVTQICICCNYGIVWLKVVWLFGVLSQSGLWLGNNWSYSAMDWSLGRTTLVTGIRVIYGHLCHCTVEGHLGVIQCTELYSFAILVDACVLYFLTVKLDPPSQCYTCKNVKNASIKYP